MIDAAEKTAPEGVRVRPKKRGRRGGGAEKVCVYIYIYY